MWMSKNCPDWQLPPGVNRGLWDYLHDPDIANGYDQALKDAPLLAVDSRFAERHFARTGDVIDLGCGTGRLAVRLASLGHRVVGVDLSEEMLRVLGTKARAANVNVARAKANLVQLDGLADQSFDYAACLFSTLGMIAGAENRRRVLQHAFRLLRAGGVFVLHVHNRWHNLYDPAGRRWLLLDSVGRLARSAECGDRPMPTHNGLAGLALHHYTQREIIVELRQAGFIVRDVQRVGLSKDGRLSCPWFLGRLRCYGHLLAAERPRLKSPHSPASAGRE
jgi:SAM-dependent methyltransferase